jgi:crotonobetainyl-CoA:carnitine CoA-transferase CaiB-like acyl-CoA transferase
MHAHPHTLAREMVVETEHARVGPTKAIGLPVKFSRTPGAVETAAPTLGQHSRAILAEHGFDEVAIERLFAEKAVA